MTSTGLYERELPEVAEVFIDLTSHRARGLDDAA